MNSRASTTLAPEIHALLAKVDEAPPARMDASLGEHGFVGRVVALDGAVFLPIDPPETALQVLLPIAIGCVALLATIAVVLWFELGETAFMSALLGAALLGAGAHALLNRLGGRRLESTGILCVPDQLVMRTRTKVLSLPRVEVAKIEERMQVINVPKRGVTTAYQAVVVMRSGQQVVLAEFTTEGEPDLTFRASHVEGQFIGALVRYLIREWRDADSLPGTSSADRLPISRDFSR
ncbi:hypothetical protein [Enhygromyxa salina]|nr:hypothetical protein [Enhygromyxa salina]